LPFLLGWRGPTVTAFRRVLFRRRREAARLAEVADVSLFRQIAFHELQELRARHRELSGDHAEKVVADLFFTVADLGMDDGLLAIDPEGEEGMVVFLFTEAFR